MNSELLNDVSLNLCSKGFVPVRPESPSAVAAFVRFGRGGARLETVVVRGEQSIHIDHVWNAFTDVATSELAH